jgi:hypothetical protein
VEQYHHSGSVVVGSRTAKHTIIVRADDQARAYRLLKPDGDILRAMRAQTLTGESKGGIDLAQEHQQGVSASGLVCYGHAAKVVQESHRMPFLPGDTACVFGLTL